MQELNIKQLVQVMETIAEEKNLPEETVMDVVQQAIAAAWRRDNGDREQGRGSQAERTAHASN